jgi:hypothetical protein
VLELFLLRQRPLVFPEVDLVLTVLVVVLTKLKKKMSPFSFET